MQKNNIIINELRKNARLRIGVWLILAILAAYSLVVISDYQAKIEANHSEISNKFKQLENITRQSEWQERAEQSHNLRVSLEDKLWISNTKGLAEADFQAWLLIQAKLAKIEDSNLNTESTSEMDGGKLWRVVGKLNGKFSPDTLNRLLLAISQYAQLIVIEKLDIQKMGKRSIFTLVVAAYFQAPESQAQVR